MKIFKTFLKEHWKITLICISIASVILGLAVAVYIFKTPSSDLPANANFFDKVFNFLDEWASAGAPAMMLLAVLAALGIGITTILQTRSIQKAEKRERLLNEIIEWAVDAAGCGSDISILFSPEAVGLSIDSATEYEHQEIAEAMTRTHLGTLLLRYKAIVARREYVRTAVSALGGNLPTKEKDVSDELNKFLPVLDRRIKGDATDEDVRKAEEELNEYARILIEEVTKIKTRGII